VKNLGSTFKHWWQNDLAQERLCDREGVAKCYAAKSASRNTEIKTLMLAQSKECHSKHGSFLRCSFLGADKLYAQTIGRVEDYLGSKGITARRLFSVVSTPFVIPGAVANGLVQMWKHHGNPIYFGKALWGAGKQEFKDMFALGKGMFRVGADVTKKIAGVAFKFGKKELGAAFHEGDKLFNKVGGRAVVHAVGKVGKAIGGAIGHAAGSVLHGLSCLFGCSPPPPPPLPQQITAGKAAKAADQLNKEVKSAKKYEKKLLKELKKNPTNELLVAKIYKQAAKLQTLENKDTVAKAKKQATAAIAKLAVYRRDHHGKNPPPKKVAVQKPKGGPRGGGGIARGGGGGGRKQPAGRRPAAPGRPQNPPKQQQHARGH